MRLSDYMIVGGLVGAGVGVFKLWGFPLLSANFLEILATLAAVAGSALVCALIGGLVLYAKAKAPRGLR